MRIWALTGIVGNGRTLRSENRVQANDVAKAKMATMTASGRALSARLPQTGFPLRRKRLQTTHPPIKNDRADNF